MTRLPPRSTLTDTLLPYTTRFRSLPAQGSQPYPRFELRLLIALLIGFVQQEYGSMQSWFREFMKNRARPGIRIRARLDSRRQIEDRAMMTDAKADSAALEGPSGPPLSRFERQRGKILDAATMLLDRKSTRLNSSH